LEADLRNRLGLIYGILVTLILLIGFWWVFFLVREGENYEKYHLQRHKTDIAAAYFMLETSNLKIDSYQSFLDRHFSHLQIIDSESGLQIVVDSKIHHEIHKESKRRQKMFIAEGAFFVLLLLAGTSILTLAVRREQQFKRARELFLAGATHELKTPLACLRLYTETLQRPELDDSHRGKIMSSMIEDMDRLENIIEQVLSGSSEENIGGGKIEIFDVRQETELIVDEISRFVADNNATVTLALQDDCRMSGNRSTLGVALRNLMRNAVLYAEPAEISITLRKKDNRLLLSVSDNGPGIEKKDQKRIFESFQRIENSNNSAGSGLGLYLVTRAVKSLDGSVSLASEPGIGSTFTLNLPAIEVK
jgi:two-component system, OmpR family, sensor histidine kinase CiaH